MTRSNDATCTSARTIPTSTLEDALQVQKAETGDICPDSQQEFLWNWLANPDSTPWDLLDLLVNGRLTVAGNPDNLWTKDSNTRCDRSWMAYDGYRSTPAYLTLLEKLPSLDNPTRPAFRKVLAVRVGELFTELAKDKNLRSKLQLYHWSELFNFAHHVCIPDALGEPVLRLQQAFDKDGQLPYPAESDRAHEFMRLLSRVQPDNSLASRWIALLRAAPGNEKTVDNTLPATYLAAWRAIRLLPEDTLTYDEVTDALTCLCQNVSSQDLTLEARQEIGRKIAESPTAGHLRDATTLALATLWPKNHWLEMPDPVVFAGATVSDVAFLGGLLRHVPRTLSDHRELIEYAYEQRARKLSYSANLRKPGVVTQTLVDDKTTLNKFLDLVMNNAERNIKDSYRQLRQRKEAAAKDTPNVTV